MRRVDWTDNGAPSILRGLMDARLASKAANAAAKSYKGDVLDYVAQGAPFVARRGGPLERSIKWRTDGQGAKVYTKARHAVMLEDGTRAHAIGPRGKRKRKAVKFSAEGGFLIRRAVAHPGTPAKSFFFAQFAERSNRMAQASAGVLAARLGAR
jgi:hypothetical protein